MMLTITDFTLIPVHQPALRCLQLIPAAGLKNFPQPITYDGEKICEKIKFTQNYNLNLLLDVEFPERPKLRFFDKVPQMPPNLKAPKMQKRLRYMRGPDTIHNFLLNQQYGIQALVGGRMRWGHFEMLRLSIGRKMDVNRMFCQWRVDAPWQPLTKQGQGQRMGGGKGSVDHYVTPVKAGRIILELAGKCEFGEVEHFLNLYAAQLPFNARAVSHEMLQKEAQEAEENEKNNQNKYTMKFIIQNNLSGIHRYLSPVDHKWFGKYN